MTLKGSHGDSFGARCIKAAQAGCRAASNGSNAQLLKGMLTLIDQSVSGDAEVLAVFMELHERRQNYQAVADTAARVPGLLTSKMRATPATAAAQSGTCPSLWATRVCAARRYGVPVSCVQFHRRQDPGPRSGRRCACGSSRGAHSLARHPRTRTRGQPRVCGCTEGRVSDDPRPRRRV